MINTFINGSEKCKESPQYIKNLLHKILLAITMPQVLDKRYNSVGVKTSAGCFEQRPISKQVSYAKNQRFINELEDKLMKKYNCGYSTLVKSLITEKYQQEFREYVAPFY